MTIFVDPDTLTTMASLSTTTNSDEDEVMGCSALTATSMSSTISSASSDRVYAEEASRYVASLSNQEIVEFVDRLSEKEESFEQENESVKVLIKR